MCRKIQSGLVGSLLMHMMILCTITMTLCVVEGNASSLVKNSLETIPTFSNFKTLTFSGFGSGASMAVQMQFAHSKKVAGVASFSGLPYYCIKNNLTRLETCFKHTEQVTVDEIVDILQKLTYYNLIDDYSESISSHRVYLQSGSQDKSLTQAAAIKSRELFEFLNVPKENIKTVLDIPSGHAMVSVDYSDSEKNKCGSEVQKPYIQNCGFDLVADALKFLLFQNDDQKFVNNKIAKKNEDLLNNLFKIDQTPFASQRHLMGDYGYLYIPSACQKDETKCTHIHVAFHGCDQLEEEFALYSGYNRVAEQNNIVVMYPRSSIQDRYNPHGCWDFFGTENGDDYRSELYLARLGPQMQTVARMIEQAGHNMDMKKLLERSAAEVLLMLGAVVLIFVYQMYKLVISPSQRKKKSD
ncbi:hypothetical protein C9374_004490 [Naegleria lovaniensis]|uniref:Uncharacterized protein n=1 Tax=Naegleria lovaniensis TaxID=51637 RepID=A0AA88GRG9_NAELO|nr:uncharacterized protein C9374_004490 [Naegleria lovaniensis]KAG2383153.1 hypothetical protein C9374_004490 [Naegleria lovaniensis]